MIKIKSVVPFLALGAMFMFGGQKASACVSQGIPLPNLNEIPQQRIIHT